MADLPRIHGVGGPVRVSVPGKSELMISVIGPIAPESPEARIWAVLRGSGTVYVWPVWLWTDRSR